MNANESTLPTYFISHGGGPWPWMKESTGHAYDRLEASLAGIARQIGRRPASILMISAHWEEPEFTVMAHPQPPMLYDYRGFPAHTYHIRYDAPGSPELARRVHQLLESAGHSARLDAKRGFDHGLFSPMAAMYPQADVPVIQLSLKQGLDPRTHVEVGQALAPLRNEDVLIVGSGLSYHNLRKFGAEARDASKAFDDWLGEAVLANPDQRVERLLDWSSAPAARIAHPREEHLIPLMVSVGAAGQDLGVRFYHQDDFMGGVSVSSFRFGAAQRDSA